MHPDISLTEKNEAEKKKKNPVSKRDDIEKKNCKRQSYPSLVSSLHQSTNYFHR